MSKKHRQPETTESGEERTMRKHRKPFARICGTEPRKVAIATGKATGRIRGVTLGVKLPEKKPPDARRR